MTQARQMTDCEDAQYMFSLSELFICYFKVISRSLTLIPKTQVTKTELRN